MARKKTAHDSHTTASLNVVEPYDFALSLRVIRSFQPAPQSEESDRLRLAARIDGAPTMIEVSQDPERESKLEVSSGPQTDKNKVLATVAWALFAELDLNPFYRLIAGDLKLAPVTRELHGLKPMRPVSLFEMAVVAITEQQISLAAAYKIRSRIVQRFGEPAGDQWIFPEPSRLAKATSEDLRLCGLSRQKIRYIHELAGKVADGKLNLDSLKNMDDEEARETIMSWKGFGRWSADYILVRGLARPDCVPVDDLAVRSVIGEYLGDGPRTSPQEVEEKLAPFRPFRGLLAFYLLAKHRLNPDSG